MTRIKQPKKKDTKGGEAIKFRFNPHIAIEVDNLNKAKKFYMDVLGMDFLAENNGEAKLSAHGANFFIGESKEHRVYFAFDVDSLTEAKKILLANNCTITSESPKGFMADDPHGLSYFVSEITKS
jgi:catechol 2,3-dioxygenase-like lactoylglutathione lyase family enzyme